MAQPIPYLSFNGNCREAMEYYQKTFSGEMREMLTFGDPRMAEYSPKETHHLIMHARLEMKGGGALYAGDCPPNMPYNGINGCMLALTLSTEQEASAIFDKLADGGQVTMPLAPSFWAKVFGMVTDRYGVAWGINGEEIPY
jgi:PhnB protein